MSLHFDCIKGNSTSAGCIIQLLDNTDLRLPIRATDNGSVLLDKVCGHLDLYERDYFGLRFFNTSNKTSYWLDVQKNVLKQLKRHGVKEKRPTFYFGVKFYVIDPCSLKEELTRYLFFLQLRSDVSSGRIPISFDTQAELGALVAQAELGDYNPHKHFAHYTDTLCLSESTIPAELEHTIIKMHKSKYRGLRASQCESKYLDLVSRQSIYGIQLYNVKGVPANVEYQLGISPHGLVQHEGKTRLAVFTWPMIDAINFKRRELRLTVRNKQDGEPVRHVFKCMNTRTCKQIWKASVEHHAFFRLQKSTQIKAKPTLFQLGSKHRYSGRTIKELAAEESRRNQPQVRRNSLRASQIKSGTSASDVENSNDASDQTFKENDSLQKTITQTATDEQAKSGLFTSGRSSPGLVNDIRLKFPTPNNGATNSEGADMIDHRIRNRHRNGRSSVLGSDNDSIVSTRSHALASIRTQNHTANYPAVSHGLDSEYSQPSLQPSAERIVSGYTKHNRHSDRWRRNDKFSLDSPKPYENITYDEYGQPTIEQENIPYYQQSWLEGNKRRDYSHVQHGGIVECVVQDTRSASNNDGHRGISNGSARSNIHSINQRQQGSNYYSQSPQQTYWTAGQPVKKSQFSLGFYEDELFNKDSGTDSPTYNPTEDYYGSKYTQKAHNSQQLKHSNLQYNHHMRNDSMYI